ncbi:MAG: hypothetical protein LBN98_05115 [Prevotellaceae bacterium]|jgi:hypothetical protein|nr:hypothetical protein [Prevotellaceae bacterium]
MKENDHLQAIPEYYVQQALELLNQVNALLQPYEQTLTPEERKSMLTMGDKSVAFVEKAYDLAVQNPTLVPSYLNMSAFDVDKNDALRLRTLLNTAQQVVQGIADTEMVSGSEAFQEALVFYNNVKYAASQDVHGAKAVYEELRKRFPRRRHRHGEDNPED